MTRPDWLRSADQKPPVPPAVQAEACDVLFVCTGNICRSAYGHLLLAKARPDLVVRSAGIGALVGKGIDPPMGRYLPADQTWPTHVARQATVPILRASSLILAMEDHHVAWVIETSPSSGTRTFTMRQLVRLVQDNPPPGPLPANRLARRYSAAAGEVGPDDGIADPYRRSEARYQQSAQQIDEALAVLAPLIDPSEDDVM